MLKIRKINARSAASCSFARMIIAIAAIALLWQPVSALAQSAEQNTAARYLQSGYASLKTNNYGAAIDAFEESIRYVDTNASAHLGLGMAYFHQREDNAAERELNRALELNPREAAAYQVLGELYYRKDDFESAISSWQKAVELAPSNTALKARLERIQREHSAEKDFNKDMTGHFVIKYEGREKIEAGRIVLRILEDAYGEIGRALSSYPSQDIQVILYSDRQFQEVTDAPGWSGGIFDGKIRLPIGGIERETPGLRRLLCHEYTHAVVRMIAPRVPTWLNEGLAQHFEGKEVGSRERSALRLLAQAGKVPSLRQLEGSFMGLSGEQAAYAYLLSLSAVNYLADRHGVYRLKSMLEELGAGADTATAVDRAFLLSYDDLDREWKRSLE